MSGLSRPLASGVPACDWAANLIKTNDAADSEDAAGLSKLLQASACGSPVPDPSSDGPVHSNRRLGTLDDDPA
jgi:hypothetical protein